MAAKFTFLPTSTAGTLVPYDEIPAEVIKDLEDAYEVLALRVGRIHAVFDTADEKVQFTMYAASWAAQRPDGKLIFRWSPTKGQNKELEGDFTIKRDLPANGKDREVTDGSGKGK